MLQALSPLDKVVPRVAASIANRIDVRAVSRSFGHVRVLEDLHLSIEPGEFVTLLGPSGSGKSTLPGMITGFLSVTSGEILVDGTPVQDIPAHKRGFGMVFQSYALFPHMTVAQNVAFPLRMAGIDRASADRSVAEVLTILRLSEHLHKLPLQLSGGQQQQRVAIARAIAKCPRVVLMDEPLSALDRRLRESTLVETRHLHRTLGMTVIFVTHDQSEALALSDRIAVLDTGRIVQFGKPTDLYRRPANKFVAGYQGFTYYDFFSIPKNSPNPEAALKLLSYRLDAARAARLAEFYAVPVPSPLVYEAAIQRSVRAGPTTRITSRSRCVGAPATGVPLRDSAPDGRTNEEYLQEKLNTLLAN